SYLNDTGRAGFVMSSQASSAGGGEAKVRRKLVETGDVDVMIAIRSNFFYTRTVPCELWFLNRNKSEEHRDKVLMLDARNVYRKVTRKIYDFSPEQEKNLLAVVWLYRGQREKYLDLLTGYCRRTLNESARCLARINEAGEDEEPLGDYAAALTGLLALMQPFLETLPGGGLQSEPLLELDKALSVFEEDVAIFAKNTATQQAAWKTQKTSNGELKKAVERIAPLAERSRDLIKQSDLLFKLIGRVIEICEKECMAKESDDWSSRDVNRARKLTDEARGLAVDQLKQVRYFWKQAHWLTERFPDAKLRDVEGLDKLVDVKEIEANDWSLTPGRYVGVAPEEEDEDFDFEEALREIHVELEDLNTEAVTLAALIKRNFQELGI
ncbi:TPA: SAM-dependent DNA methyltransferase, partial [Candidatus Micrarchaeota archaeon]|nr:SAM-dependent DNA methyltransferase [Candidatus Micrarchaeota archaeon]